MLAEAAERGETLTLAQVAERADARLHARTLDRLTQANATKAARWEAEAVAALTAEGLDPTPEAVAERVAELRSAHMRWVVSHRRGRTAL